MCARMSNRNKIAQKINSKIDDFPDTFAPGIRFQMAPPIHATCPKSRIVRIALVPMSINLTKFKTKKKSGTDYEILYISKELSGDIAKQMVDSAGKAAIAGANLIVFSELSFPILEKESLEKEMFAICKKYNCFIVAGSYHETYKKDYAKNKCLIFTPVRNKPLIQIKLSRGYFKKEKEKINVPDDRIINIINTKFGKLAIIICVDVICE